VSSLNAFRKVISLGEEIARNMHEHQLIALAILSIHLICCCGLNPNLFEWRGTTLYLKEKGNPQSPISLKPTEKYPAIVEEDLSFSSFDCLPLLPEAVAAFPGSRHFLYINEMKFREMFSDMFKNKKLKMIRCYVDGDGGVAPDALVCNIVECQNLKSGHAMYVIEGEEIVEILKIIQRPTSSYLTAYYAPKEVKFNPQKFAVNEELCIRIYRELKIYLRLARLHASLSNVRKKDIRKLCMTPNVVRYRPDQVLSASTPESSHQRHRNFVYAIASSLKSSPAAMQQIFEGDLTFQLAISCEMIKTASLTLQKTILSDETNKEKNEIAIKQITRQADEIGDTGEDLFPSADYEDISLSQVRMDPKELLGDIRRGSSLFGHDDLSELISFNELQDFDGNIMQ
jgi:hypothetical protein